VRTMRLALGLVGWLALCWGLPVAGAAFSGDLGQWYGQLHQPPWSPPAWVFGPVWATLYTLMGLAAWLVWRQGGWAGAGPALTLFLVQLLLNAAWTPLFFGLHNLGAALVEVGVLWVAIVATLLFFWRHSTLAGVLLLPYLAWVGFAGLLNYDLWLRNP
jgi:translocator protein